MHVAVNRAPLSVVEWNRAVMCMESGVEQRFNADGRKWTRGRQVKNETGSDAANEKHHDNNYFELGQRGSSVCEGEAGGACSAAVKVCASGDIDIYSSGSGVAQLETG